MKKIMMLLCAVCLLIGCTSSQKAVKYQVAKNYFFVNNSPYSGLLKITTEQELGKYFGMAATMGKDLSLFSSLTESIWTKNSKSKVIQIGVKARLSHLLLLI